jgi:hypothetical protein
LALFISKNIDQFKVKSDIHNTNTRNRTNLFQQTTNLAIYQKGPEVSAIQIYNHLPSQIRNLLSDVTNSEKALKEVLHTHSFHSLDKFFGNK